MAIADSQRGLSILLVATIFRIARVANCIFDGFGDWSCRLGGGGFSMLLGLGCVVLPYASNKGILHSGRYARTIDMVFFQEHSFQIRRQRASRLGRRPSAHAAIENRSVSAPDGISPCSISSAITRNARALAFRVASSGVAPYTVTPGSSGMSPIQRPSVSRSNRMVSCMCLILPLGCLFGPSTVARCGLRALVVTLECR